MLPVVDSRTFLTLNMSIYELFHLFHVDMIGQHTGALFLDRHDKIVQSNMEILCYVGQGKEATAIDACLTMDEDCPRSFTQKGMHGLFESSVPI